MNSKLSALYTKIYNDSRKLPEGSLIAKLYNIVGWDVLTRMGGPLAKIYDETFYAEFYSLFELGNIKSVDSTLDILFEAEIQDDVTPFDYWIYSYVIWNLVGYRTCLTQDNKEDIDSVIASAKNAFTMLSETIND